MKLNKKYLFLSGVMLFQIGFFSDVSAYCEAEINRYCSNKWRGEDASKVCFEKAPSDVQNSIKASLGFYCDLGLKAVDRLNQDKNDLNKLPQDLKTANPVYRDHQIRYRELEICKSQTAIDLCKASNGSLQENSQSSSSTTSPNPTSSNQSSQQNSSPEEVERINMKNNYAEKTAAYEQKYKGRGKKHNLDAFANQCIKTKGRKVLNICDFDVEAVFCAKNPDPNSIHAFETASAFDCARNSIGMWPILARKALSGVFTAESVSVFACKKPSHPSGAEYDHQKRVIVARCSEY